MATCNWSSSFDSGAPSRPRVVPEMSGDFRKELAAGIPPLASPFIPSILARQGAGVIEAEAGPLVVGSVEVDDTVIDGAADEEIPSIAAANPEDADEESFCAMALHVRLPLGRAYG